MACPAYQSATSSRSQSTSGCFSSAYIGDHSSQAVEISVVETLPERWVGEQLVPSTEDFASLALGDFHRISSLDGKKLATIFIEPLNESCALNRCEFAHS